jgi:hypothetical protein
MASPIRHFTKGELTNRLSLKYLLNGRYQIVAQCTNLEVAEVVTECLKLICGPSVAQVRTWKTKSDGL